MTQYFNKLDDRGNESSKRTPKTKTTTRTGSIKKRERKKPVKLEEKTIKSMQNNLLNFLKREKIENTLAFEGKDQKGVPPWPPKTHS